MADPPHIDDPTPTSVDIFGGIFSTFWSMYAVSRDAVMVISIIGRDCIPVSSITLRLSPNPRSITAYWRIFFDVNLSPGSYRDLSFISMASSMPYIIAITGPPATGYSDPRIQEGTAIRVHISIPAMFFLIALILFIWSSFHIDCFISCI